MLVVLCCGGVRRRPLLGRLPAGALRFWALGLRFGCGHRHLRLGGLGAVDRGEDDGRLRANKHSLKDGDIALGAITICGHQGDVLMQKPHSTVLKCLHRICSKVITIIIIIIIIIHASFYNARTRCREQ